ncbi:cobyrinate a,c-diamide synthase [Pseudohoeflea coraliihabitans]|uniref:Hydrogenobyrinate a,c-diamide synthase n=1 Tax=Pseudohoeflea coraliihabitans TaxID=2860393 RepID=A0ABS6WIG3_9HYPH|nr:cobyrinate a,c-diamide synthase [Pseudohoeflea sp. DP4N28-3]MBW3095739.1 cobyrinate a,c-diamide synthase [Pseudohoeflea sp. DP4N28-3]
MKGLMIAAPQSGSGKTTVTLGLLRALRRNGIALAPAKAGPDYIDPAFHTVAAGAPCLNFDPWAMRADLLRANASLVAGNERTLVVEAMMGLFDAAADGKGSSADLGRLLGLPVVLVIDCARLSHSVAPLARGFFDFAPDVYVAGVILNRVGSTRHAAMLSAALADCNITVYGSLPHNPDLTVPERHLGLVQAQENDALETFIEAAADHVAAHLDMAALTRLARHGMAFEVPANILRLPPLGQHIAVARDKAFSFIYEHLLFGWRRRGATISFFSPLADEGPDLSADAVFLPGGYPELHAGRIAAAQGFRDGMAAAIDRGAMVYGECGGYMVLGDVLVDAAHVEHAMLGVLPVTTSFAQRQRHLGYRRLTPCNGFIWDSPLTGHEFHYSSVVRESAADPLFMVTDARGTDLGAAGQRRGRVAGSYMHIIDIAGE